MKTWKIVAIVVGIVLATISITLSYAQMGPYGYQPWTGMMPYGYQSQGPMWQPSGYGRGGRMMGSMMGPMMGSTMGPMMGGYGAGGYPATGYPLTHRSRVAIISNFAFRPSVITIPKGSTVTWVNRDAVPHGVVSGLSGQPSGIFDSGVINLKGSYSYTFNQPGTYPYFCEPHPYMRGTIVVAG